MTTWGGTISNTMYAPPLPTNQTPIALLPVVLIPKQVKWQGKAHYHATWERNSTLASCRGIRKLENYFKRIISFDIDMMRGYTINDAGEKEPIAPEEKEKWSLDRERDADALMDYKKVERVIGCQQGENGNTEYYVKCRPLQPHSSAKKFFFFLTRRSRERSLLRRMHLGRRSPDQRNRPAGDRPIPGPHLEDPFLRQTRVQSKHPKEV
jgi:hypothetical protein